MAAFFPGNAIVRLSLFCQSPTQTGIITRNYSAFSTTPGAQWSSTAFMAALIAAGLPTEIKDAINNVCTYLGMKVYWKPPSGGPPFIDTNSTGSGGGTAGDPAPAQLCGLIKWQSAVGGPQGKGRDYVPFPAIAHISDEGLPSGAYIGALTDIGTAMEGPFTLPNVGTGGGSLGVSPCTLFNTGGSVPLAFPMNGFTIGSGFATQRRRGFYGKPNSPPL